MKVYIYIDPEYNGSVWCSQTLKGLTGAAVKRHYGIYFVESEDIFSIDLDKIYKDEENRVLIVLTTRVFTDLSFYDYFADKGVSLLFVNHQSNIYAENYSNILVDYREGMADVTKYLLGCNKKKSALFAVNPASSTDQIKKEYFLSVEGNREQDIIYNNGSLTECCQVFYNNNVYDSVICANDVAAYSLINYLSKKGVNVPKDLYVVSFGDSLLSQKGIPSLTTVSVDHTKLGRQALHAYSYLYRRGKGIRTSVYVTPKLNIRESTENKQVELKEKEYKNISQIKDPMYCDITAQSILKLEKMLDSCDKSDFAILRGIIEGKTYSKLAEELYMSEKTVSYRVACMKNNSGCASKEELCALVSEYVSLDSIV